MEEDSTTHPDEGTIHAWLDDALDAATAARIAEHVRTCATCTERVAEARGLIAGASRIVASLDDVPAGARVGWAQSAPESGSQPVPARAGEEGSLWRRLRVTPARAAIAATVLVALGITMTHSRSGPDDVSMASRSGTLAPRAATMSDTASPSVASAPAAQPMPATPSSEARDPLLDSAIRRNLAIAQPPRALDAAQGPAIPQPTTSEPVIGLAKVDTTAPMRVADARREVEAQREQQAGVADKSRVRGTVAAPVPAPTSAESQVASSADAVSGYGGAMVSGRSLAGVAVRCYLIESEASGATWGGQPLPILVSADSAARIGQAAAGVLTVAGQPTGMTARFATGRADSLTLTLRRLGYSGTIALGPDVGGRAGTAFSAPVAAELGAVVATGTDTRRRDAAGGIAGARKATEAGAGATRPEAPSNAPAQAKSGSRSRVTMRLVGCPAR